MTQSIRRINAIFIKELQDLKNNLNVLLMYFIPPLIVYIYKSLIPDFPPSLSLGMGLVMLASMIGLYLPAMIIAEEKEKKTLGALMLSPARPIEVFTGKGLVTLLTMLITFFVVLFLSGNGWKHFGLLLGATLLAFVCCILQGMLVGLLAENQMATGIIGLPLMLPSIMIPFLTLIGNEILSKVALFIPSYHYFKLVSLAGKDMSLTLLLPYWGALAGFILISLALLLFVYQRKGLEQ